MHIELLWFHFNIVSKTWLFGVFFVDLSKTKKMINVFTTLSKYLILDGLNVAYLFTIYLVNASNPDVFKSVASEFAKCKVVWTKEKFILCH